MKIRDFNTLHAKSQNTPMPEKPKFKLSNPVHFLALGFGSGLLKPAPGTWGTLSAVPIYWLLAVQLNLSMDTLLLIVIAAFVVGVYLCGKTAADVGEHDHAAIVWDEIVGYLITMLAVVPSLFNIVLGFALFRFFDILKPWPIKVIDQKVHGGFGIMLDDVIAGIAAAAVLYLIQFAHF
jgi:phosphatidylglycerophosphatase A